jgi:L-serine dehydratase
MISIFDIFKIGVGPSSSHTVGPMKAARAFAEGLGKDRHIDATARVTVWLLGSLAWTGKGHATDRAVILGLAGTSPDTVTGTDASQILALAHGDKQLRLNGCHQITFDPAADVVLDMKSPCPKHPNTMVLAAFDAAGARLAEQTWLSIGGGFIVREDEAEAQSASDTTTHQEPYQFRSAANCWRSASNTGSRSPRWSAPTNCRSARRASSTRIFAALVRSCSTASNAAWRRTASCRAAST